MNTPSTDAFNPYAAPTADTNFAPGPQLGEQAAGSYYAMGVAKLWIMSVLTFGLYNFVFFYRHWRYQRDHMHQDLSPFWRTFFSHFMYFGLNVQVKDAARSIQVRVPAMLGAAPFLYFAANVGNNLLDRVLDENSATTTLLGFALVPVATYAITVTQSAINRILESEGHRGTINDGATAGSIIFGILGGIVWVLALLGLAMGQ